MSSRIRLEGKLEVVEAATLRLEQSVRALSSPDAAGCVECLALQLAPELREAESAVRNLVRDERSLATVLNRLERARSAFTKAVHRRLEVLGLPQRPLDQAVLVIEDEPIRYARKYLHPIPKAIAVVSSLQMLFLFTRGAWSGLFLLIPISVALLLGVLTLSRITLTPRRLCVNEQVFELGRIQSVRFAKAHWSHRDRRIRCSVRTAKGDSKFKVPKMPTDLIAELERVGVVVLVEK